MYPLSFTNLGKTSPGNTFADVFIFRSDDGSYRIPEPISSTSSDQKIKYVREDIFPARFYQKCHNDFLRRFLTVGGCVK